MRANNAHFVCRMKLTVLVTQHQHFILASTLHAFSYYYYYLYLVVAVPRRRFRSKACTDKALLATFALRTRRIPAI